MAKIKQLSSSTVDEYIEAQDAPVRKILNAVRKAIKAAAPKAEEKISYRIPLYRYKGHLAAFMAAKDHCSFVTMSQPLIKSLKSGLKAYEVSGTTIHFTPERPLPPSLVKKIIKARIKENELKSKSKSKNKRGSRK